MVVYYLSAMAINVLQQ